MKDRDHRELSIDVLVKNWQVVSNLLSIAGSLHLFKLEAKWLVFRESMS
jgi:hypothetical protein